MPRLRAFATDQPSMRLPWKQISPPESGVWNPMTTLTSVDLPEPLSPSRPTISRRSTLKLTPDSERTSPKDFETFLSSMTGGSPAPDEAASVMPPPRDFRDERGDAGAAPRPSLSDFLGRQGRDNVDILLVDEGAG